MNTDLWGNALLDYCRGVQGEPLVLHTSFGDPEVVPMDKFIRDTSDFSELELLALDLCKGPVLDIGAGVGCHSRFLQQRGQPVTALEKSPGACKLMRQSGIMDVVEQDIYHFTGSGYQTALMLMNGLGLAGKLDNLSIFLEQVSSRLSPGGQILADSCDVQYLYQDRSLPKEYYYGEQRYCYEYKGVKDVTFPWLFIDMDRLKDEAGKIGFTVQIIFIQGEQYLARIQRSQSSDLKPQL